MPFLPKFLEIQVRVMVIVVTENVVFKARFKRRISVESNSVWKLNATEMFESIAFDCVKL